MNADVVLAEIIETGLLEEMQLKVMNELRRKGVIGGKTKVLPAGYETFIKLVDIDNSFYGYKIMAPMHDWPYYSDAKNGWEQVKKQDITEPQSLGYFDFQSQIVSPDVDVTLDIDIPAGKQANGIELSGMAHLTSSVLLGATNAFNGPKILYIDPVAGPHKFKLRIDYSMGKGLGTINFRQLSV
jgi:predicted RNA methylase